MHYTTPQLLLQSLIVLHAIRNTGLDEGNTENPDLTTRESIYKAFMVQLNMEDPTTSPLRELYIEHIELQKKEHKEKTQSLALQLKRFDQINEDIDNMLLRIARTIMDQDLASQLLAYTRMDAQLKRKFTASVTEKTHISEKYPDKHVLTKKLLDEDALRNLEEELTISRSLIVAKIEQKYPELLYLLADPKPDPASNNAIEQDLNAIDLGPDAVVKGTTVDKILEQLAVLGTRVLAKRATDATRVEIASKLGEQILVNRFPQLRSRIDLTSGVSVREQARLLDANLRIDRELLRARPNTDLIATWKWLKSTANAGIYGVEDDTGNGKPLKIFPTPHYKAVLERALFLERKLNGTGGTLFVGPPGSGKTEMAIEKNRQLGYETAVIQMHAFSTFSDLIGSRGLNLGMDRKVSLLQQLQSVSSWAESNHGNIVPALRNYYETSRDSNGSATFGNFISGFLPALTQGNDSYSDGAIEEAFKAFINTKIAGLALSAGTDNEQAWINGEIIAAMRQGKRVILDEIDKSGQFAIGGLLTLLAKSPGETIQIGAQDIKIPEWFSIDATANSLEASGGAGSTEWSAFLDRYSVLDMGYPPLKDSLMIAAVHLSNDAGQIILSPEDQWRIVATLSWLIPGINEIADKYPGIPSFSNRGLRELCGYLVDPRTRTRTKLSIVAAVRMYFTDSKKAGTDDPGSDAVQTLLENYSDMLTQNLISKPRYTPYRSAYSEGSRMKLLSDAAESPIVRSIASSPDTGPFVGWVQEFVPVELTDADQKTIPEPRPKIPGTNFTTSCGFSVLLRDNSTLVISSDAECLFEANVSGLPSEPSIVISDASHDGSTVVLHDSTHAYICKFSRSQPDYVTTTNIDLEGGMVKGLTPDGLTLLCTDKSGSIVVRQFDKNTGSLTNFKKFWNLSCSEIILAPDGRIVLVESTSQGKEETYLYELQTLTRTQSRRPRPIQKFDGLGYQFATSSLVVNMATGSGVLLVT